MTSADVAIDFWIFSQNLCANTFHPPVLPPCLKDKDFHFKFLSIYLTT